MSSSFTLPPEVLDLLGQEFRRYVPPAPDPAGFDVSQSELTLRTIPGDSFERPTRFYGDIYAAGGEAAEYLLGRVDFGAVPGGWCDRSADGDRLAFTYQVMEGNSFTSATLRWLDLRAVDQVHEVAPELILLSPAAWSPTAEQIAFSACTDLQDRRACSHRPVPRSGNCSGSRMGARLPLSAPQMRITNSSFWMSPAGISARRENSTPEPGSFRLARR
jgi:hypothetical protein